MNYLSTISISACFFCLPCSYGLILNKIYPADTKPVVDQLTALIHDTAQYLARFDIGPIEQSIIDQVLQGDKRAPRLIADDFYEMGTYAFIFMPDGSIVHLESAKGKLQDIAQDDLLKLSARWYQIATERGDGLAMRGMALLAETYLGIPDSYDEWMARSFKTLQVTAETSRELLFLTRCYGRAEGTVLDHAKAVETYLRYIERCKVEKKLDYVPPSNCMTPVPEHLKQYSSGKFTQEQLRLK